MSEGRLCLLVMSKQGVFRKTLSVGRHVAGRAAECELRLEDGKASRQHFVIDVGAEASVTDLGSRNGTLLGGQKLVPNQAVPLRVGVPLVVGSTVLIAQATERELPALPLLSEDAFVERVAQEQQATARNGGSFGVATIRFHSLGRAPDQETHGSTVVGDESYAAARLDRGLRELMRAGDVLAYVGPAEYRVLIAGATAKVAEQVAEVLRAGLAAHEIPADVGVALSPRDGETLATLARAASSSLRPRRVEEQPPSALERLRPMIDRVAVGTINVLILGETGAGKEVLARALHQRSKRAAAPMLCLNCAALSETLLESELFGYERGAFTGAVQAKPGLLESADGGTVLLDEIGDMPMSIQARVLRVLETREVTRLGAIKPRSVDVRLLAATHRDLEADVTAGRFRQDLYFRINGVSITLPPLRERLDEIEPLATLFATQISKSLGRGAPPRFSAETWTILRAYVWPGNVRELRNVIERAVLMAGDREEITTDDLPLDRLVRPLAVPRAAAADGDEMQRILGALEKCAGNQTRAAEVLGISRRTLVSRLKQYDIPRPHRREAK